MHNTRPLSQQAAQVIKQFFQEFERLVLRPVRASGQRVLFVLTPDHRHVRDNPWHFPNLSS